MIIGFYFSVNGDVMWSVLTDTHHAIIWLDDAQALMFISTALKLLIGASQVTLELLYSRVLTSSRKRS